MATASPAATATPGEGEYDEIERTIPKLLNYKSSEV
jgi:hypothetical protein